MPLLRLASYLAESFSDDAIHFFLSETFDFRLRVLSCLRLGRLSRLSGLSSTFSFGQTILRVSASVTGPSTTPRAQRVIGMMAQITYASGYFRRRHEKPSANRRPAPVRSLRAQA